MENQKSKIKNGKSTMLLLVLSQIVIIFILIGASCKKNEVIVSPEDTDPVIVTNVWRAVG